MMDHCAPGSRFEQKPHNWWVYFKRKEPAILPLGKHGARQDPEIEMGHVKKMIRFLDVNRDCASTYFPILKPKTGEA